MTGDVGSVVLEIDKNDLPEAQEAIGIVLAVDEDFDNIIMGRLLNLSGNLYSATLSIDDDAHFTIITGPSDKINELDPAYEAPDSSIQITLFELSVFPNPTDGEFQVEFTTNPWDDGFLKLYDASGRLMYKETITPDSPENRTISDLSKGIYLLELKIGKEEFLEKLVVGVCT